MEKLKWTLWTTQYFPMLSHYWNFLFKWPISQIRLWMKILNSQFSGAWIIITSFFLLSSYHGQGPVQWLVTITEDWYLPASLRYYEPKGKTDFQVIFSQVCIVSCPKIYYGFPNSKRKVKRTKVLVIKIVSNAIFWCWILKKKKFKLAP